MSAYQDYLGNIVVVARRWSYVHLEVDQRFFDIEVRNEILGNEELFVYISKSSESKKINGPILGIIDPIFGGKILKQAYYGRCGLTLRILPMVTQQLGAKAIIV